MPPSDAIALYMSADVPRAISCSCFVLAYLVYVLGQTIVNAYQADIRAWINARGGLTRELIWMRAPDTYQVVRKCLQEQEV